MGFLKIYDGEKTNEAEMVAAIVRAGMAGSGFDGAELD